ncbi:MAG: cupin domain-containing protein [Phycisphaerae bacterium]|nr:cupin domain-containing protein [Phycisphaerae bacterium]
MSVHHEASDSDRLRAPPVDRFAGLAHRVDIAAALKALRDEPQPPANGRRQITVYHRVPVTTALFDFEAGGALNQHTTHGLVTIQVIEGRLVIEADGGTHELRSGQLLILNPDVPHSVRAPDAGVMLLTVHMERD